MKKLFFLFVLFLATTSLWAYDFQSGNLYYNITSSSAPYTVEVTYQSSWSPSNNYSGLTSVTIPSTVRYKGTTYSVTSIGGGAFRNCSSLTSVTIPNSVTSIGDYAFADCSSLASITIPNSVTSIGSSAFYSCSSLTSITIPNSVTSIGDEAFSYCSSLTSITIPNSVTSIGDEAFFDCSSLTSVTIPNSVTSIGEVAFYECSSLTSVTIPNSVTSIGGGAFYGTGIYNDESNWEDGVLYIDDCLIEAKESISEKYTIKENTRLIADYAFEDCSSLTSITIPNSVKSIGDAAFYNCSSLASITIPNSVTSIGDYAFADCSSLASITIPNSVTSIGDRAFYSCSSLTSVIIPNSVTSIGDYAFARCSSLTSVTIPNSVTSIGDEAFFDCSSLTSVTIPNSVTSIGQSAFEGCSSLTSVTINSDAIVSHYYMDNIFGSQVTKYIIGESVTSIGDEAFRDCSSLTSVTIGNSVTSIGYYAFRCCFSLTSVTIGNSVTSIGDRAFYSCSSLTSVTCEAEIPPTVGKYAFDGVSISIPVYVPCGCVEAYKAASDWKDFTNIQEPLAEYSIEVDVNDNIMGTAKVDINSSCDTRISATANYGYHFVQWSDGATDNPRTLILTQDITFTAEFAPNTYTISSQSSDTERGTTSGDVTTTYLDYVTISATANYGYHFAHWDDYNYDNPRQVQVTENKIYTAYFDKNTYYITKNYDSNQGYVDGYSSGEYLDNITLTAEPNYGYHFVQWSDGNTDNPRHFILTQDTTFSAEFAQTFSGQCGDNLYWNYDKTNQTISITGSDDMYDYTAETQPWLLFKEEIIKVTTTNTVTSIGTSAFEGCVRLAKISLGTGLEEIATNAFAGCTRLYDIYVYATYPPFADESSFANYNVYVYIPCEYQRDYTLDVIWGKFKFIVCVDSEEVTTDDVVVTPGTNDVTMTWPTEGNADTYTIVIKKGNEVFCTLTFNAEGQLLNIAFAPGRDGNHPAQYAEQAGKGYRFTVTGLEEATDYTYDITVKDASNKTIKSHSGEFTTQSTTAVDNITTNNANIQKIMRDGQFIILRDGVEYNAVGQEL